MENGFEDAVLGMTLVEVYNAYSDKDHNFNVHSISWPKQLLPISDDDDDIKYCIDCAQASYPIIKFDAFNGTFEQLSPSFQEWLEDWL